jgi:hypothetical protein
MPQAVLPLLLPPQWKGAYAVATIRIERVYDPERDARSVLLVKQSLVRETTSLTGCFVTLELRTFEPTFTPSL